MTKPHKEPPSLDACLRPADRQGRGQRRVQEQADHLLAEIMAVTAEIGIRELAHNRQIEEITAAYNDNIRHQRDTLKQIESNLMALMKKEKALFFDGTDIVNLIYGSLIHSIVERVKIPRDKDAVIALCEELGFAEVVKIAKSLDRDAVEKWPDEKLFLIGAERKQKEAFSYDLKEEGQEDGKGVIGALDHEDELSRLHG